jgi:nitrogenase molybdenum-iron protein beta chain
MIIHKNRNGCSLHGALKILDAVDGFIPIVHSNAGCSLQSKLSENLPVANAGAHYRGISETPDTDIFEKQVIFGGTARLREQIKNTIKVEKGDLYVVVTGCAPEIVGDDTPAMVKEAQEQGFPVITVGTPGFNGSVYDGYVKTLQHIAGYIAQTEYLHVPDKNLVNILGIVPKQDLLWEGNLQELSNLLSAIGLKSNKLFGFNENIETWRSLSGAALNLVVSPWGLPLAQWLEQKYNIPYLYWGYLPVGAHDTSALLQMAGKLFSIPEDELTPVIQSETKRFNYRIRQVAQSYIRHDFQKEIALVGETSSVLGIGRFLQDSFGQMIVLAIITDQPNKETQERIRNQSGFGEQVKIVFSSDGKEIDEKLAEAAPGLILGSSLEQKIAAKLSVPLLKLSAPVYDKLYLQQTYVGYNGAVQLIQDFAEVILKHNSLKQL